MEQAHALLKDVFGLESFRLAQEQVIERLIVGAENALVLFPTGGGKSLTYQLPALCFDGLTLVISPLLALMREQVETLRDRGVKAANMDSTNSGEESIFIKQEILNGNLKLLYIAPERLNNEGFINMISQVKISLLAVDESHCISQWGANFRPDYLKIARFALENEVERVLCLTATGTPEVAADICTSFMIDPEHGVFRTPMYRSNLALEVAVAITFDDKIAKLIPLLKARTGPAIVYVTLQKHAEEVANALHPHNLDPMVYHAGLPSEKRQEIQDKFMQSEKGIVCATIAFGMGIDKATIRQVIHLHQPKTLEGYAQEVGRAGRDGLPSTCLMFLSSRDIPTLEGFCVGDTCRRTDLELWAQEVCFKTPNKDGTLDFNHYAQSKDFDIRSNVLGLLYAELELQHELAYIRATTPFYTIYDITVRGDGLSKMMADNSPAAKAIHRCWSTRASRKSIDVVTAAASTSVDRESMAKTISRWELDGFCSTKPSQVRARYIVLKPFPKTMSEVKDIVEILYARMLDREVSALAKLRGVMNFATDDDCLAHNLAVHFGDHDAVPNGMCGKCTYCKTGSGVDFTVQAPVLKADPAKIKVSSESFTYFSVALGLYFSCQAILGACHIRDDPRLLARMAFGIVSPRLTANKWSTFHPLFASMVDTPFDVLVKAFDVVCKKAKYENGEAPASPSPVK